MDFTPLFLLTAPQSHEPQLIDIDHTVFVQLGLFLLLILVLSRLLWKPYLRVRGERVARVEGYREEAARLEADAQQRLDRAEAALAEARRVGAGERAVARAEAQAREQTLLAEANAAAQKALGEARGAAGRDGGRRAGQARGGGRGDGARGRAQDPGAGGVGVRRAALLVLAVVGLGLGVGGGRAAHGGGRGRRSGQAGGRAEVAEQAPGEELHPAPEIHVKSLLAPDPQLRGAGLPPGEVRWTGGVEGAHGPAPAAQDRARGGGRGAHGGARPGSSSRSSGSSALEHEIAAIRAGIKQEAEVEKARLIELAEERARRDPDRDRPS